LTRKHLTFMNTKTNKQTKQTKPTKINTTARPKQVRKKPINKKHDSSLARAGLHQTFKMSHCALLYGAVIVDPFHAAQGACIPCELFPLPSQKVTKTLKGSFSIGTGGFGFIVMDPTLCSDKTLVNYTTNTSVGTNATLLSAFTNQAGGQMPLPYIAADLVENIQGRIVGAGLRARYSGPLMSRRGNAAVYENPDHQSIIGGTFDTLMANNQADAVDVSNWTAPADSRGGDSWMASLSHSGPCRPTDVEFNKFHYPLSGFDTDPVNTPMRPFMGIIVKGAPGDEWAFEAVLHLEYIGTKSTERTPNHADPVAFSKVLEASKNITANGPMTPAKSKGFFEDLAEGFKSVLPALSDGANLIKSAVTMDIGGVFTAGANLLGGHNSEPKVPLLEWKV